MEDDVKAELEAGVGRLGAVNLRAVDSSGLVFSTTNRRVNLVGVTDLVVVDTEDELLILPREHAQAVGRLV